VGSPWTTQGRYCHQPHARHQDLRARTDPRECHVVWLMRVSANVVCGQEPLESYKARTIWLWRAQEEGCTSGHFESRKRGICRKSNQKGSRRTCNSYYQWKGQCRRLLISKAGGEKASNEDVQGQLSDNYKDIL